MVDSISLSCYDVERVKKGGRRFGRMDKRQAMEEVIKMNQEDRAGDLTTGMCEVLGISFESFLKFAQIDDKSKAIVIEKLAGIFILELGVEKFGHCSQ
jgi:hypothetical protein